ncbi:MAG: alpha/beta hydrolase [Steroidobacteraceae bacterium]
MVRRPLWAGCARAWAFAVLALLATALTGCESLSFALANAPAHFGPFTRHANLAYGPDRRQRLDVYAPRRAHDAPVVVFWYGGSWQDGRRQQYRFVGAALASAGFVAVLPDYRLHPQVVFPAFVEDAARAYAWAAAHATQYGGDPAKMFVMGHSAGAHQAAMLALEPRWIEAAGGDPRGLRGLIGLSGPYVLTPNTPALNRIFAAPATLPDWQPVQHVTASAPPALLIHGLADELVDPRQSERLSAALAAAGVAVRYLKFAGRNHADTVAALSVPARRRAPVLEEVRRFVRERSGPSR